MSHTCSYCGDSIERPIVDNAKYVRGPNHIEIEEVESKMVIVVPPSLESTIKSNTEEDYRLVLSDLRIQVDNGDISNISEFTVLGSDITLSIDDFKTFRAGEYDGSMEGTSVGGYVDTVEEERKKTALICKSGCKEESDEVIW